MAIRALKVRFISRRKRWILSKMESTSAHLYTSECRPGENILKGATSC